MKKLLSKAASRLKTIPIIHPHGRVVPNNNNNNNNNEEPDFRAQFLSDLHLEVGQQYATFDFEARSPYLILAGDIGRLVDYEQYLGFLQKQARRFRRVFLVLGNHEFYGLDYDAGILKARVLVAEPVLDGRVVLLHRARYNSDDYDDDEGYEVTILGCTLWSGVPDDARDIVAARVKDFQKIEQWTVEKHNAAHAADLSWLREEVAALRDLQQPDSDSGRKRSKRRVVVVVTHHAPCMEGTSSPKNSGNAWGSAFATDLLLTDGDADEEMVWSPVQAWVFGHTHFTADFVRNGVRVVSNQRGYVLPGLPALERRPRDDDFDPGRVLRL